MTPEHLAAILDAAAAKPGEGGFTTLPEGKALTLYVAHDGVPLTVSRVEAIAQAGKVVRARTSKGELFVLALDDVFAAATEATSAAVRRAGFSAG